MIYEAIRYAQAGWPIFPVAGVVDAITGDCSCRDQHCKNPGKHPLTGKGGFHLGTTDLLEVERWWTRFPRANIGLKTGGQIFVVDVDGQKGQDEWNQITQGKVINTLMSATGGGGYHLFFSMPEAIGTLPNRKLGKHKAIDIRAGAGYVILPPSVHRSGNTYEWMNPGAPLQPIPDWLLHSVQEQTHYTPPRPALPAKGKSTRYGEAVLEHACRRLSRTGEGNRNNQLAREAFVCGQYIAGGEIDPPGVLEQLMASCHDPDRKKTETTAILQLRQGALYPRQAPAQ